MQQITPDRFFNDLKANIKRALGKELPPQFIVDLIQEAPNNSEALTTFMLKARAKFPGVFQANLNTPQKRTILGHLATYLRAKGIKIDHKITGHQPILCFGLHISDSDAKARFADFRSSGVLELPNRPKIVFWDEVAYAPAVPMDPLAAAQYASIERLGQFSATFPRDLLAGEVTPSDTALITAIHRHQMQRATTPQMTQQEIDRGTTSTRGAGDEFFDFQNSQIRELSNLAQRGCKVEYRCEEPTPKGYLSYLMASSAELCSWDLMTQGRPDEALQWYAKSRIIHNQLLIERDRVLAKTVADSWRGNKLVQHFIVRGVDHEETFPTFLRSEGVDCRVFSLAADDPTRLIAKERIELPVGEYDVKSFAREHHIPLAKMFMAHLIKQDYMYQVDKRQGILEALRQIQGLDDAKVELWFRDIAATPPKSPTHMRLLTLKLFCDF